MEPVTAVTVSSKGLDLGPLARALRLRRGDEEWRRLKGKGDRYLRRCERCGSGALRMINEPCVRKRHTRTAHRRRTVVTCLVCGNEVEVFYGV
jgi:hypothetical protein